MRTGKLMSFGKKEKRGMEAAVRDILFKVFHQVIEHNLCGSFIYIIFLALEFLQMIAYALHISEHISNQHENTRFSINLLYYIRLVNGVSYLPSSKEYFIAFLVSAILTTVMLIIIISLTVMWKKGGSYRSSRMWGKGVGQSSVINNILSGILGIYLIALRTFLFMPLVNTLLPIFSCKRTAYTMWTSSSRSSNLQSVEIDMESNVTCYAIEHYLLMFWALILICVIIVFVLITLSIFTDQQPDAKLPWANIRRHYESSKFIKKLIICIPLNLNMGGVQDLIALVLLQLINLGSYREVLRMFHIKGRAMKFSILLFECFFFWAVMVCLLISAVGLECVDWFLLIPVPLFMALTYLLNLLQLRNLAFSYSPLPNSTFQKGSIEKKYDFIRIMATLFEQRAQRTEYLLLHGVLYNHFSECTTKECKCRVLEEGEEDEEGTLNYQSSVMGSTMFNIKNLSRQMSLKIAKSKNNKKIINSRKQSELEADEEERLSVKKARGEFSENAFFQFLKSELWNMIENSGVEPTLFILLAYVDYIYLNNKFIALYDLMNASETESTIFDRFLIFRLQRRIEESMVVQERVNEGGNQENLSLDVHNLINFQQQFTHFQENMSRTVELYLAFWKELIEDTPTFDYLNKIAYEIMSETHLLRRYYRNLTKMNLSNVHSKMLYALFLKKVVNDDYEAYEIFEQVGFTLRNLRVTDGCLTDNQRKYGANSRSGILLVSGSKHNIGEVLGTNNELEEMLGYEKIDLTGANISKIMPVVIGSKHNILIKQYFDSSSNAHKSRIVDKESTLFALNKQGAIVTVSMLIKLVPNLLSGIVFIGFMLISKNMGNLRDDEEEKLLNPEKIPLLLTNKKWEILGLNRQCARLFGIDLSNVSLHHFLNKEEKPNLGKLIPELEDESLALCSLGYDGLLADLSVQRIKTEIDAEIDANYALDVGNEDMIVTPERLRGFNLEPEEEEKNYVEKEGQIEVKIKCTDLRYGIKSMKEQSLIEMRLVTIQEFQRRHTVTVQDMLDISVINKFTNLKLNEKDVMNIYDMLNEDGTSAAESTMSSLKYEGRSVKDFKVKVTRGKTPLFLRFLNKAGVALFLILVSIGACDMIMNQRQCNILEYNAETVFNSFSLLEEFITCPIIVREIQRISLGLDENVTQIFQNKMAALLEYLKEALEELRSLFSWLRESDFSPSQEHSNILTKAIIPMKELTGNINTTRTSYFNFNVAFNNYISKLTELTSYTSTQLLNPSTLSPPSNLAQAFYYLIENGKHSLKEQIEQSAAMYYDESIEQLEKNKVLLMILAGLGPFFVLICILVIVPYIMGVYKNVLIIFNNMTELPLEQIKVLFKVANEFTAAVHFPYKKLNMYFNSQDFVDYEENEDEGPNEEPAAHKLPALEEEDGVLTPRTKIEEMSRICRKPTMKKLNILAGKQEYLADEESDEDESNEDGSEDSEEKKKKKAARQQTIEEHSRLLQKKVSENERRSSAKKKIFKEMINSKRGSYILRLNVLFIFYLIFFVTSLLLTLQYYKDSELHTELTEILSTKDTKLLSVILFHHENYYTNTTEFDKDGKDLLELLIKDRFDVETKYIQIRNRMRDLYNDFINELQLFDTNEMCNHFFQLKQNVEAHKDHHEELMPHLSQAAEAIQCKEVYRKVMYHGFGAAVMNILKDIQTSHFKFTVSTDRKFSFLQNEIKTEQFIMESDIFYYYINILFDHTEEKFMKSLNSYYADAVTNEKIKFGIFSGFLLIVFIMIWVNMTKTLKLDILRGRGAIHIFPTTYLNANPDFLKLMSKTNLLA